MRVDTLNFAREKADVSLIFILLISTTESTTKKKSSEDALTLRAAYCVIFQFPEKGLDVITM